MNDKLTVSIGMPVYNGGEYIRRALDSLLSQTFTDFELIISDNASSDNTESICREYELKNSQISYIRQKNNLGAIKNFSFVLEQARGQYFMWAAHDDFWDNKFLETLLGEFNGINESVVALGCEAQYTIERKKMPFFYEGKAFHRSILGSNFERVSYILKYSYGNLFYSLYKKEVLFVNGMTILSIFPLVSLNEIPLFIRVASQGGWKIVPQVLFYKETNIQTYMRARWEMEGGWLQLGEKRGVLLKESMYSVKYHLFTAVDLFNAIRKLPMSLFSRTSLVVRSCMYLVSHLFFYLLRYKKKVASVESL